VSFRSAYARALEEYLRDPSEGSLRVAYELGRDAVRRQLSVLDLAIGHQDALLAVVIGEADASERQRVVRAAGDFLLESLSSFEMVQRGYGEAHEAASRERRRTRMSRQLSTFLADASLALDDSGSIEEMLRLVAEQARELLGGDCCVATVAAHDQPRTAEAASLSQPDTSWTGFVRWLDLPEIYRLLRVSGGSLRLAGDQLSDLAPFRNSTGGRELRGWLAASLTALDGSELGAIQLFDEHAGRFTEDDEAALVHLAQMASAAVDRARLYQRGR
jgi:hypothetical protein